MKFASSQETQLVYKEILTRRGMKEIQKYVCQPVDLQEIYNHQHRCTEEY
jgi:hypothetical protein